jgi:RNase P protein component
MELTKRERETYDLFTNYKKQNPSATNQEAFKATKTNTHTLHVAKKKLGLVKSKNKVGTPVKRKYVKSKSIKPKMETIVAVEPQSQNFAVIICNRNNIQDVLNAIN